MADGSFKPIEEVRSRDRVLAVDPKNPSAITVQTVSSQVFNTAPGIIDISWDEDKNGTIDGTVSATPEHPFYLPEVGWQPARKLERGMRVSTMSGQHAEIVAVRAVSTTIATYNLDVDGPNTFFSLRQPQVLSLYTTQRVRCTLTRAKSQLESYAAKVTL